MKKYFLLMSFFISANLFAGSYIITGAQITKISSTSGNLDEFVIWTKEGSGPCKDVAIKFTLADSGSPAVFDKAYSMALTAFTAGFKVSVHNYHGSSCARASYIHISK
jgi:hypothetical protein